MNLPQIDLLVHGLGSAYANGTATAYLAGTSTLATWYSDSAGTTPAANPYTLSVLGAATLYSRQRLKIDVKNSAGVSAPGFPIDQLAYPAFDYATIPVSNYATLNAAVTALGSTVCTLLLDSPTTCTDNLTVPANISLQGSIGGIITISTGKTLTINGLDAGQYQVFSGGAVVGLKESNVMWFGANGIYDDGDDSAAFMAAINALPANGGGVKIPAGSYNLNISPTKPNVSLVGAGMKATRLFNNTTVPGTYAINYDLGALDGSKLPQTLRISGMSIIGSIANSYHGLRVANCLAGTIEDIEFNEVSHGLFISWTYGMKFKNLFFREYAKGIQGDPAAASNDNTFENMWFFGGNTVTYAGQPMLDVGINNSTFINFIADGSLQMGVTDLTRGNGNTYITPRWESCTPVTGEAYVKFGGAVSGHNNKMINPLITFTVGAVTPEELTTGRLLIVSGNNNEVDRLGMDWGKNVVQLDANSTNCKVRLNTSNIQNQVPANVWMDYGSNNLIDLNGNDFIYNNESTNSSIFVQNNFLETTDMSGVTADGLTHAGVTGANSTLGPLKEGLIRGFTSVTGNRKWTQNIVPADGAPSNNQVVAFSIWVKSLTSGGELVDFLMGHSATPTATSIHIPSDKFVRVVVFNRADAAAYADYVVGMKALVTSSGFQCYGPQVAYLGVSGTNLPQLYPGGFVPTEAVYNAETSPNYPLNRRHKIAPATGTFFLGNRTGKIRPIVGQPKGWLCTVTSSGGNGGTHVSEGNL